MLGPLEIAGAGGTLRPPAGKHRVLLGGLLLRANRTVGTDELIDWLWGESPPPSARQALSVYVLRVRQAVGAVAGDLLRISTAAGGYTLEIEPAAVDALLFRDLVARAGRAGDPDTALRCLRQAERLWRGPALVDVPSDRLQTAEAMPLSQFMPTHHDRRSNQVTQTHFEDTP